MFQKKFINRDVIENVRPQLTPIIPAGTSITVPNDAIEMLPDNIDKTFNDLSKYSNETIYLLRFLRICYLSLISAKK